MRFGDGVAFFALQDSCESIQFTQLLPQIKKITNLSFYLYYITISMYGFNGGLRVL